MSATRSLYRKIPNRYVRQDAASADGVWSPTTILNLSLIAYGIIVMTYRVLDKRGIKIKVCLISRKKEHTQAHTQTEQNPNQNT